MRSRPSIRVALKIPATQPIAYADKPVLLGGKLEYLDSAQLSERLGLTYTDNIYIDDSVTEAAVTQIKDKTYLKFPMAKCFGSSFSKLIKNPSEYLVICNMGTFGHGVFASQNIPKQTMISFYSGTFDVKNVSKSKKSEEECDFMHLDYRYFQREGRGMASFFQHLPDPLKYKTPEKYQEFVIKYGDNLTLSDVKRNVELYSTVFLNKESEKDLATANIYPAYFFHNNTPIIAFITDCIVKKGEMIGFNYGYNYWEARNTLPEFFKRNGQVISHLDYYKTFGLLRVGDTKGIVDYQPAIKAISIKKNEIIEDALVAARAIIKLKSYIPADLPQKIIIKHDDSVLNVDLTDLSQQLFFYNLHRLLVDSKGREIRKLAFQPNYEISAGWLLQVHKHNSDNLLPLLEHLKMSKKTFEEQYVSAAQNKTSLRPV